MSIQNKTALVAWLMGAIFYAYQYILRVMPNIMLPDIMKQFQIDASVFGQFSGVYYIGYCLMHLPIGIFLDRYGPKNILPVCILMTTIGLLPIVFAEHWFYPIMGRFIVGAGSSAAILGTFKIIQISFRKDKFSHMLSLAVTIGLLGAIYGGMPVSKLCEIYTHKTVTGIFVVMGIGLAVFMYLVLPKVEQEKPVHIKNHVWAVLKSPKFLLICGAAGLMVGPMEGFADAWGSTYLRTVLQIPTQQANQLCSLIYMGMCCAPALSYIAQKTGRYFGTISVSGLLMTIFFVWLVWGAPTFHIMSVGFFVVGICCAYQILAIYKASVFVPPYASGLSAALANMIIMGFGYLFHSCIGFLIKHMHVYGEPFAYRVGISVIPLTLMVATGVFGYLMRREVVEYTHHTTQEV